MDVTGRVVVMNGESRIAGRLLARPTANPLGDATNFLAAHSVRNGNCAEISGDPGTIGDQPVIVVTGATRLDDSACQPNMQTDALRGFSSSIFAAPKKKKSVGKKKPIGKKKSASKKKSSKTKHVMLIKSRAPSKSKRSTKTVRRRKSK